MGPNVYGNLAPELRNGLALGEMSSVQLSVQAELFELGMVLWCLGNSTALVASRVLCRAFSCESPISIHCVEDHINPVRLPPCADPEVPAYYNEIIASCRNADPRDRIAASALLQSFPTTEEVEVRDVSSTTQIIISAGKMAFFTYCDECCEPIEREEWYKCNKCSGGADFDICVSCHLHGVRCLDTSHTWSKVKIADGKLVKDED
jgi:hypothetical protein